MLPFFACDPKRSMLFVGFSTSDNLLKSTRQKSFPGGSEGGAAVFRVKYFGDWVYLAQSPQLYKQMAIASDFRGVVEVGPVFRAETSFTPRHLTEFIGMDFEMEIMDHYHEVVDTIGEVFCYIFDQLNENAKHEIDAIRTIFPSQDIVARTKEGKVLVLDHTECMGWIAEAKAEMEAKGITEKKALFEAGVWVEENGDFNTPNEKWLGGKIKELHGVDFYIIDKYPLSARPFYTMPCPHNSELSNSYDAFLRGEEILSGAQRIHDPAKLIERAHAHEIPIKTIKDYVNCFKHGCPPHGGGGIGLERVVMLFLGLPSVRRTSLFPRTPDRVHP
eukprot:GABV01000495.1.p1 GENE.GABV01000495.1~~GABV01000495.1.p1  ORF type:complete len:332 (-),score=97.31 GABV01000495.1:42-1037(-)